MKGKMMMMMVNPSSHNGEGEHYHDVESIS